MSRADYEDFVDGLMAELIVVAQRHVAAAVARLDRGAQKPPRLGDYDLTLLRLIADRFPRKSFKTAELVAFAKGCPTAPLSRALAERQLTEAARLGAWLRGMRKQGGLTWKGKGTGGGVIWKIPPAS